MCVNRMLLKSGNSLLVMQKEIFTNHYYKTSGTQKKKYTYQFLVGGIEEN